MDERAHECDNCGHEAQGYTRVELEKYRGWTWNPAAKALNGTVITFFIMCDSCNGAVAQRAQDRSAREQRARVPRANCSHCGAETIVLPAANVVVGTEFNLALPTSFCRDCDRYPQMLRPVEYTSADWALPDFFFPEPSP